MTLKLLVSPLIESAWYAESLQVAVAELTARFGPPAAIDARPTVTFVDVDTGPEDAVELARLSWVQAQFLSEPGGALRPLDVGPDFGLPAGLVWGGQVPRQDP